MRKTVRPKRGLITTLTFALVAAPVAHPSLVFAQDPDPAASEAQGLYK